MARYRLISMDLSAFGEGGGEGAAAAGSNAAPAQPQAGSGQAPAAPQDGQQSDSPPG